MLILHLEMSILTNRTEKRSLFFFFFNDTATTEIYTLSLHDALPTSASAKRKTDKDRLTLRCLPNPDPSSCHALPPPCSANPAGGPDEIDLVVASQGADLDVGWTGVDHNFPFPVAPNAALKACVRTCGPTGSPPCDLEARTGLRSAAHT